MLDQSLLDTATALLEEFRSRGLMIATAESCTGGLIAGHLTEIAGSSDVVDRGFVTYSNEAKRDMLGVDMAVIEAVGAVSEEVAGAMAEGALARSRASVSVAVTGVAGPGASEAKPAGLVWFGCAGDGQETVVEKCMFSGDRTSVRQQTVAHALELARKMAGRVSA